MELYETDFYAWTQETAIRLRRGEFTEIDLSALVEEVESLGKGQKSALQSRLTVLIAHLLKWDHQPAKRSASWQATIQLQRSRIHRLLAQSPSLRPFLHDVLPDAYSDAVLLAVRQTGFDQEKFAASSPYTLDEILKDKDVSTRC